MSDVYADVRLFHELAGQPIDQDLQPMTLNEGRQLLRISTILDKIRDELRAGGDRNEWVALALVVEETAELVRAVAQSHMAGTSDAIADLMYVVIGASVRFGIPLAEVWEEVQRANISKFPLCPCCGGARTIMAKAGDVLDLAEDDPAAMVVGEFECPKCGGRGRYAILENGKVQKPPSWEPPDIEGVLKKAGRI